MAFCPTHCGFFISPCLSPAPLITWLGQSLQGGAGSKGKPGRTCSTAAGRCLPLCRCSEGSFSSSSSSSPAASGPREVGTEGHQAQTELSWGTSLPWAEGSCLASGIALALEGRACPQLHGLAAQSSPLQLRCACSQGPCSGCRQNPAPSQLTCCLLCSTHPAPHAAPAGPRLSNTWGTAPALIPCNGEWQPSPNARSMLLC